MNRKVIAVHRILFYSNVLLIVTGLVYFLMKWGSLPAEIGMHFGPDGKFDVYESKVYGFYPHIVCGIIVGGIGAVQALIKKKKSGFRLTEKGERLFKAELLLTLDVVLFIFGGAAVLWSVAVAEQHDFNTGIFQKITKVVIIIVAAGIAVQNFTCIKYRERTEKKVNIKQRHSISRLIALMLNAGNLLILFILWNRFPGDEEKYYDPEYAGLAYFANFDAYLDKRLLFIPIAVISVLIVIYEIVSSKAVKAGNNALALLIDRLEVICGVFFFWWSFVCLETENSIGIASVSIFTALCIISFVLYLLRDKKSTTTTT